MRPYRFTSPPTVLHRARLDNLALVPANLLPYKDQWQQLANELPKGNILIILPDADLRQSRIKQAIEQVAISFKESGHRVTTLPAHQFT
jgi:hypothetical protein